MRKISNLITDHKLSRRQFLISSGTVLSVAVLAACAGLDAKSVAARIESAALDIQEGNPRDDIAILAVRIR